MIYLQAPPHPALQDCIAQYLFVALEHHHELEHRQQKFFPVDLPCITFYSQKMGIEKGGSRTQASSIYSGMLNFGGSISFKEGEMVHGFIVSLKPHGFATLFGIENREIAGLTDFYQIMGKEAELLHEQLEEAGSFADQVRIANTYLLQKKQHLNGASAISEVCRQIIQTNGLVDIKSLAKTANVSVSTLERRFSRTVGVPPKQLARIKRFHHALSLMIKSNLTLTDIAHRCGYYDQAHFIRDFESFAGIKPSAFQPEQYAFFNFFVLSRNYYR